MNYEMTFYHKDGRRGIFDDEENEANQYDDIPSFPPTKKITDFESQSVEKPDVNMTGMSFKKKKRKRS